MISSKRLLTVTLDDYSFDLLLESGQFMMNFPFKISLNAKRRKIKLKKSMKHKLENASLMKISSNS